MADLFNKQFSILPGLLDAQTVHTLIPDNKTASSIVEGFKQGQSGNYDYNRLLTEELPKVQEQIAKQSADAQSKADKLSQKMQRYSMIGNILSGIGALANTVNTAYMAARHGKRAAQIGTPLTEFGGSLAKQGLGYGEEAREYGRLANRSPAEMLGVISEKAKIGQIPFDEEYKKKMLEIQQQFANNSGNGGGKDSAYEDIVKTYEASVQRPATAEEKIQIKQQMYSNTFGLPVKIGQGQASLLPGVGEIPNPNAPVSPAVNALTNQPPVVSPATQGTVWDPVSKSWIKQ